MALGDILSNTIPGTSITVGGLIWALIVLIVGYIVVVSFLAIFKRSLSKIGLPPLVAGVLTRLVSVILYLALVLAAASAAGFNTGSVVLGLSAVIGLILGFGLQDTINNLAAGVWIAVTRPFDKGDLVEVGGYLGTIKDVGILSTIIIRPNNEVVLLPNKSVWGSPIVNYTRNPTRRITLDVGVAYGTDLDKAVKIALEAVKNVDGVLEDPAPQVVITELADSSVNLQVRVWVKKEDYGRVKPEIIKAIYNAFNEAGIEIPYPQLDVHIRDMPDKQNQ
ncbi:MAG: mechanosensitive ion channel [Desulfurococcales archaeon]|nr:mechanosensitive ion channel [Desulfurococcales archaeon]MEB3789493.1 mechanosensitive ion channel [Desulfurococcales archaeon]